MTSPLHGEGHRFESGRAHLISIGSVENKPPSVRPLRAGRDLDHAAFGLAPTKGLSGLFPLLACTDEDSPFHRSQASRRRVSSESIAEFLLRFHACRLIPFAWTCRGCARARALALRACARSSVRMVGGLSSALL